MPWLIVTGRALLPRTSMSLGAGFAGLYLLYRLRTLGFSARIIDRRRRRRHVVLEPLSRGPIDIATLDYTYCFDANPSSWTWSEKYATQPEILMYLPFVADRYDLRRDITFPTSVKSAIWDEVECAGSCAPITARRHGRRFYVMACGCLSQSKLPEIAGLDTFRGAAYFTGTWPHEGVDFTGRESPSSAPASSGIQSIPMIAAQADHLTVFQRTANFTIPARNGPLSPERLKAI